MRILFYRDSSGRSRTFCTTCTFLYSTPLPFLPSFDTLRTFSSHTFSLVLINPVGIFDGDENPSVDPSLSNVWAKRSPSNLLTSVL